MIYLDNAATTKTNSAAAKLAFETMEHSFGNPSSLHRLGLDAENLVTDSRKTIAKELGCNAADIYFTSGATESNNLAILGAVEAYRRRGRRVITTALEHPSAGKAFNYLEKQGYDVVRISPKDGRIVPEDFVKETNADTIFVSCMAVNNETGLRIPVEEIARQVKTVNPNIIFHADAAQSFCKIPVNVKRFPVDLLSLSGHKIYAPKGTGALYIKKGVRVIPNTYGGIQESGIRAGTESVPLIAAFGEAVRQFAPSYKNIYEHHVKLKDRLVKGLSQLKGVSFNSNNHCVPYIINFSVRGIRSEIMLHFLEQHEIYVSSGSACSKGKKSPVLEAMGLPAEVIDSAVRVSFGADTTEMDMDKLITALELAIKQLARSK